MIDITNWIEDELLITPDLQIQILKTLAIIIIVSLIYFFIRKILYNTIEDNKVYYKIKKLLPILWL